MDTNTKKYIVDNSYLIAAVIPTEILPDDQQLIFEQFLNNEVEFIAPNLIVYEFGNTLKSSFIKRKINPDIANKLLEVFVDLLLNFEKIDIFKTFSLAIKYNLSFYDASYLSLAVTQKAKLMTMDKKLLKAYDAECS